MLELSEEVQIIFEEEPQIVNAVAQHRQALNSYAESKTTYSFWI
jgi:hypothetical protein